MRIPTEPNAREAFYLDLMEKCMVSRDSRRTDYSNLRNWFLFGCGPNQAPAIFNKIHPHIDQLSAFLYSAETTRFSVVMGADVDRAFSRFVPTTTRALGDHWLASNADQVFSAAVQWALAYSSTFIKLVVNNKAVHPYMVEPACIGVLREDQAYADRQEAILHSYYITKTELYARLYRHPNRESIVQRVSAQPHDRTEPATGIERVILSQVTPVMYGNVNYDLSESNRYKAEVAEETVEMRELWVWNDETLDFQVVTIAEPDVVIYDREGSTMFLKGEHPFVQVCPNPLYDYFWGASEVAGLIYLQELRTKRVAQIIDLLDKQVNPPKFLSGYNGMVDEKNFALNRAGGLLANDMPGAKVDQIIPQIPPDLFKEVQEIDRMFEERSGIGSILQGRGEAGVRSAGHASQLARLGSSRAKKRALTIEDSLEKVATLYLKLMQKYDDTHYRDNESQPFTLEQLGENFVVKVDAHSNSPIFTEDSRELAFQLFKAGAIDKESLLDLVDPPQKQLLKERLHNADERAKLQAQPQPGAPAPDSGAAPPPQLKQVK